MKRYTAFFDKFVVKMTADQAETASHQGQCDDDVDIITNELRSDLELIPADDIAAELQEYGAWDEEELKDTEQNYRRIVWIAAGNINEDLK